MEETPRAPSEEAALTKDDRTWGTICHLAGLAGLVVPLGNVIGPLVVWRLKREDSAFVDDQGREAVNFHITVLILLVLCVPLVLVIIGFVLAGVIGIYALVMTAVAAIRANEGVRYRYPLTLRLIQ